jgi:hypothetical protein
VNAHPIFPSFDVEFEELDLFILSLVEAYQSGELDSWDELEERVKAFYTPGRMDAIEARAPGWRKMASYSDGITLTHVTCVFLGMFMLPEFQALSMEQKQIAKWIVLFHDLDKFHIRGQNDTMHAFRSAIATARALKDMNFPVSSYFNDTALSWGEYTVSATKMSPLMDGEQIPDNGKLPVIIAGIEEMYGKGKPATLIVKGVLLHMSLDVVKEYPQFAPLSGEEVKKFIHKDLLPLLKVMMLADNEGWSIFDADIRAIQRNETLAAFANLEAMIMQDPE